MILLATADWSDWTALSWKDQIYTAAPFAVPFVLLVIGVGLGVYYYRRTH